MYSRYLARSLWDQIISYWVERAFVSVRAGALVRRWSLIIFGGLFWLAIAWINHPPVLGAQPLLDIIIYPIQALFAADVFKHILIAGLAFWVAYRIAAIYLDDIFELKNVALAARFIRQVAFAAQYDLIEIKDGKVAPEHQDSPIMQIGGPGIVRVYLENAALFEKINGTPRVVAPTVRGGEQESETNPSGSGLRTRLGWNTRGRNEPMKRSYTPAVDGVEVLEGFERLRSVIDLRDQVVELNVASRTRDGIQVRAEDVRLVFSVYRGEHEPTLRRPYPFDQEAVKTLVYDNPPQNWTETMKSLIRAELGSFISQHTLSEFLAAINAPEIEDQIEGRRALQQRADQLAGVETNPTVETLEPPEFVSRPRMTDLFYDFTSDFSQKARRRGVQLRWIGVGTWVTPDEIIPGRHQNAWRISSENLARGNEGAIDRLEEETRLMTLLSLVKEVPLKAFQELESRHDEAGQIMRGLAEAYRVKLRGALDLYERDDQEDTEQAYRLRCVLVNMARAVFHWAGKQDGSG